MTHFDTAFEFNVARDLARNAIICRNDARDYAVIAGTVWNKQTRKKLRQGLVYQRRLRWMAYCFEHNIERSEA